MMMEQGNVTLTSISLSNISLFCGWMIWLTCSSSPVWWLCMRELFVNSICNWVSKIPVMYEYTNLQSWILYMSINLVMPGCLKSGVFCALYLALHNFLIAYFCNISGLCSLYWYVDPHNIVSYRRGEWIRL